GLQYLQQEHPQTPKRPAAEASREGTAGLTGSQEVRWGEAADSRQQCPPPEGPPHPHPQHPQSRSHQLQQPQYPHPLQLHLPHPPTRQRLDGAGETTTE
ncbi:unnamed protein product, partial [Closterium sp. NIES-53]